MDRQTDRQTQPTQSRLFHCAEKKTETIRQLKQTLTECAKRLLPKASSPNDMLITRMSRHNSFQTNFPAKCQRSKMLFNCKKKKKKD